MLGRQVLGSAVANLVYYLFMLYTYIYYSTTRVTREGLGNIIFTMAARFDVDPPVCLMQIRICYLGIRYIFSNKSITRYMVTSSFIIIESEWR